MTYPGDPIKRMGDAMQALRVLEYDDRDTLDALAHAALKAILEPTDAQLDAGSRAMTEGHFRGAWDVWSAMVRAADPTL